jgi:hypothetical protein
MYVHFQSTCIVNSTVIFYYHFKQSSLELKMLRIEKKLQIMDYFFKTMTRSTSNLKLTPTRREIFKPKNLFHIIVYPLSAFETVFTYRRKMDWIMVPWNKKKCRIFIYFYYQHIMCIGKDLEYHSIILQR